MEMSEAKLEMDSKTYRVNYLELENAVVAFFFENRVRLGTVAIAMPGIAETSVGRSSALVGAKYIMTSRALAERLAGSSGKIAMVSLFTELDEMQALRVYARLLEKISLTRSDRRTGPDTSI